MNSTDEKNNLPANCRFILFYFIYISEFLKKKKDTTLKKKLLMYAQKH
jgi:hypothetical protein